MKSESNQEKTEQILVVGLILDPEVQSREKLDQEVIKEYAEAIVRGDQFPPIVVFSDGISSWVADGFHRVEATKKAGLGVIKAEIRSGGKRDAVFYAIGANASHGLRRTNADKRRAVELLLKDP